MIAVENFVMIAKLPELILRSMERRTPGRNSNVIIIRLINKN
jgi:hypothetical protein